MTWETTDILALIFGAAGVIGGTVGFFRAASASKQAARADAAAQDARSDAASALLRSADATERIAEAIEIIARPVSPLHMDYLGKVDEADVGPAKLLRALVPTPEVRWIIEERSESDTYRLRNAGTIAAREVGVAAVPNEHSVLVRVDADPPSLEPGSAVVVRTERRLSLRVKELEITWRDDTSSELQRTSLYLP
jgi:hypothetical protein